MAALRSTTADPIPTWQRDDSVQSCPLCTSKFTWYYRRHHCRACGRVICNFCCSHFVTLPSTTVVRPPEQSALFFLSQLPSLVADDSSPDTEEVRTCNECFTRIEQDRCRRVLQIEVGTHDSRLAAQLIRNSTTNPFAIASPPPSYSQASVNPERLSTSIPNTQNIRYNTNQQPPTISIGHRTVRRRRNTQNTYQASSSAPSSRFAPVEPIQENVVPLRYVAFALNDHDKMLGEECPICFEEYESGQSIARLECWCVFHLGCIKAWKSQKAGAGGCPLHFHD